MCKHTQVLSVSFLLALQVQQTVADPQDPHVQGTGGNYLRLAVHHQEEARVHVSTWSGGALVPKWTRLTYSNREAHQEIKSRELVWLQR